MNDFIYGSRAKIGLIYPASGWIMEAEFNLMSPKGVATLTTRVPTGTVNIENMNSMSVHSIEAAKLLSEAPLDVMALGCTSASFVNGVEYEERLLKKMELETGVKCTSTSKSIIKALNSLETNRISLFTPYIDELNEKAISYIKENDIEIVNFKGLGLNTDREIDRLDLEAIYRSIKSIDTEESDAIVVFCTGLRTVPIIKMLETDLNKPVITAIQATFWNCLRLAKINDEITEFGTLFAV